MTHHALPSITAVFMVLWAMGSAAGLVLMGLSIVIREWIATSATKTRLSRSDLNAI